jgi:hypothetical protein
MSATKELLDQAITHDDAAFLWKAVRGATEADMRSMRAQFSSTYQRLDETQQLMFRSYVQLHGHTLNGTQREAARAAAS